MDFVLFHDTNQKNMPIIHAKAVDKFIIQSIIRKLQTS
jgi:hypothetical protein